HHPDGPVQHERVAGALGHLTVHAPVQAVDPVVHAGEPQGQGKVPAGERLQRLPHHGPHDVGHLLEMGKDGGVGREVPGGPVDVGDVDGDVPHALEVEVDVQ